MEDDALELEPIEKLEERLAQHLELRQVETLPVGQQGSLVV